MSFRKHLNRNANHATSTYRLNNKKTREVFQTREPIEKKWASKYLFIQDQVANRYERSDSFARPSIRMVVKHIMLKISAFLNQLSYKFQYEVSYQVRGVRKFITRIDKRRDDVVSSVTFNSLRMPLIYLFKARVRFKDYLPVVLSHPYLFVLSQSCSVWYWLKH